VDISDGDLVRLARDGDPVAFRLLVERHQRNIVTIPGGGGWARHAVTARVPDDSEAFVFGVFLAGRGRVEVRNSELAVELT
jgi:hypothetical protein